MKIGVVVHGPGIVDSNYAIKIIKILEEYGDVYARLGGIMGRTAVIDASLEKIIDISKKLVPSDSLKLFHEEGMDVFFLINYGKSDVTGQVFGYKVYNHFIKKINHDDVSVIQIERPGEVDGSVINWGKFSELSQLIARELKLNIINPQEIYDKYIKNTHDESKRIIHGVSPNENIMVNGVIIGKTNSDKLVLIAKDDRIVGIEGGVLEQYALDKLGNVDLNSAIVKTGLLRKNDVKPRIIDKNKSSRIAFINNASEDIYKFRDSCCVVSIGDDTTLVACDILYRFNVPVIGITSGNLDKVVANGFKTKDSIIFEVEKGFVNSIGCEIYMNIFNNNKVLDNSAVDEMYVKIIEIINNMKCKYKINYI